MGTVEKITVVLPYLQFARIAIDKDVNRLDISMGDSILTRAEIKDQSGKSHERLPGNRVR